MKHRLTILNKQTILLILICVISTVFVGLFAYNTSKDSIEKEAVSHLTTLTETMYKLIDSAVNISIRNYLRATALSNLQMVKVLDAEVAKGHLTLEQARKEVETLFLNQHVGTTGYVYVLDSKGNLLIHPKLKGENVLDHQFARDQVKDKIGFIEYEWQNPDDPKPRLKVLYMVYYEPWDYIISVSSYKSEFNALVNVGDFNDNILSTKLGDSGYMYVLDEKGNLIIHPKLAGENIASSQDAEGRLFIQEILKNKVGYIVYPWKNPDEETARDKMVVYRYYEPMQWYLCSGIYLDELYEPVNRIRVNLELTVLFFLLVSISVAAFFRHSLSNSFKKLADAIRKTHNGQYEVIEVFNSRDELGPVIEAYNMMVTVSKEHQREVNESNAQLEKLNDELEMRVKERTIELQNYTEFLEIAQKDLTEINQVIYTNSMTDTLTGLPNRRRLNEYIDTVIKLSKRGIHTFAVLMIDIDHFKAYNDHYGHVQGDVVLKRVGELLKSIVVRSSDIVARYGGEEFIVVLADTDFEGASMMAERLRLAVMNMEIEHICSDTSKILTTSIGFALYDKKDPTPELIIEMADKALYKAKNMYRNCTVAIINDQYKRI